MFLQEAVRPDVVEQISAACGMKRSGAMAGHSLAFLSRMNLAHHAWHRVPFAKRRYLEVVLEGSSARFFGVHLAAIHSNVTEQRRVYELQGLLKGIEAHQQGFHVVTGDFNTLAPGEELDLRRLPLRLRAITWITGGKIRWATIQRMLNAGYTDAYRMFYEKDQRYTFPTWDPHVRLDYAFSPKLWAERVKRCDVVRDAPDVRQASDHFPLLIEIADL